MPRSLFLERGRRKFTHLDFRVGPPQRCSWGRSLISVSRTELELAGSCAPPDRRGEGATVALDERKRVCKTHDIPLEKILLFWFFINVSCRKRTQHQQKRTTSLRRDSAEWSRSTNGCCSLPEERAVPSHTHHRSITLFTVYCCSYNSTDGRGATSTEYDPTNYSQLRVFSVLICGWPQRTTR